MNNSLSLSNSNKTKIYFIGQSGRSMIEMLGVLAIVGVLTIGGIMGFSKAMNNYKMTQTIVGLNGIVANLTTYQDELIANGAGMRITNIMNKLGFIPEHFTYEAPYIYDNYKNKIDFAICNSNPCWKMFYNLTDNKAAKKNSATQELCIKLFTSFIKENSTEMTSGDWQADGMAQIVFKGDSPRLALPGASSEVLNRTPLSSMTIAQITNNCEMCITRKNCRIHISF